MVQPVHARAVWCTYGAAINASSLYNGARAGSQRVSTYCNAFGLSGWKQIDPASERFSSSFHRTEAENGYEEGEREREREKLAPKRRENGGPVVTLRPTMLLGNNSALGLVVDYG